MDEQTQPTDADIKILSDWLDSLHIDELFFLMDIYMKRLRAMKAEGVFYEH